MFEDRLKGPYVSYEALSEHCFKSFAGLTAEVKRAGIVRLFVRPVKWQHEEEEHTPKKLI